MQDIAMMRPAYIDEDFIGFVLKEDIGRGDITTLSIAGGKRKTSGVFMAKENLVVCGMDLIPYIYSRLDNNMKLSYARSDGESIIQTDIMAVIEGNIGSLLTGERTVLNFIQRLSGIASITKEYVGQIKKGSKTKITDTRKTTPGWRGLEKYAVRTGGGVNHRFGLDDGILIKDNHIKVAGSIKKAVDLVRKSAHHLLRIEVETTNMDEVREALHAGVDVIMLDNMDNEMVEKALIIINDKALIEVSGGVTIERIADLSAMNVDFISVGAITHSATAKDINLTLEKG